MYLDISLPPFISLSLSLSPASLEGWELLAREKSDTVYRRLYQDTGLYQYKVIGRYHDITARDYLEVQVCFSITNLTTIIMYMYLAIFLPLIIHCIYQSCIRVLYMHIHYYAHFTCTFYMTPTCRSTIRFVKSGMVMPLPWKRWTLTPSQAVNSSTGS